MEPKQKNVLGPITNERIPYEDVRLASPEGLGPYTPITTILATLNRKYQFLELVSEKPDPIVRIKDAKQAYRRERERALKATKTGELKEVSISWSAAEGDLERKLKKAREELEKGHHVELHFARKQGQPVPTPKEMNEQIQRCVDALVEVSREPEGERHFRQNIVSVTLRSTVDVRPAEDVLDKVPARKLAAQIRKERALKRETSNKKDETIETIEPS